MNKVDKIKGVFAKTSEEVHTKFKVMCAKNKIKMSDALELLMLEYSKGNIKL